MPATLQHDDLHDANVFVSGNRHRFFDWGDACVSHPFLSLLVALRVAREQLALPTGHPILHRLRDSYLYEWRDHESPERLREQCRLHGWPPTTTRPVTLPSPAPSSSLPPP